MDDALLMTLDAQRAKGPAVLVLPADPATASRQAARQEIEALLTAVGLVPAQG